MPDTDTAPAWARGYPIEELREITDLFRQHDGGLPLGAFTRVRETHVADWLARGQLIQWRDYDDSLRTVAVVSTAKAWRGITDFAGRVPARIPPGEGYVARMACRPGDEEALGRFVGGLRPYAVEIWQEHPAERAVVEALGLNPLAVKVRASSELRGVYGTPPARPYPREQQATLTRLPLDGEWLSRHAEALAARIRDLERSGLLGTYADHYSSYNRGHAWSALSLRGYADDAGFIVKPAEMSRAWKAAHPGMLGAPLRDTWLRGALLPHVEPVLAVLGGRPHRIRLMRLEPGGGELTRHADITDPDAGVGPGQTLRIHIPLVTNPAVEFTMWQLDGTQIAAHMPIGTAWYLDTRKPHRAVNGGTAPRLHLVADIESSPDLLRLLCSDEASEAAPAASGPIGVREWVPGDACASCGSSDTYIDNDGVPACRACHRSDADE
jgi:hypothetical protein